VSFANLLSLVMRNFNFVVCLRWSDKRSFSILSKTKAICPKDAGLSLVSLGWERKEKLKFGRSQATPVQRPEKIFNFRECNVAS